MVRESVDASSDEEFQPLQAGADSSADATQGEHTSLEPKHTPPSKSQPGSASAQGAAQDATGDVAKNDVPGQGSGSRAAEHGSG